MTPNDWTLIAIASAGNRSLQPVQLQKSLFLIGRNLSAGQLRMESYYKFEPYDYGPFSHSVYSDAEELEKEGLVIIQRPPETRYKLYSVTEAGSAKAAEIEKEVDKNVIEYVRAVVGFTQKVSFNQLVSAIYKEYPEMKANSVFQE